MSNKDVLSEGELDALMDSVAGGEVEGDDSEFAVSGQLFNFNTREHTLLAKMPALKNLNEKHSIALAQSILELYKIAAHVDVNDITLVKLDQAIHSISGPSGINLIKIAPLNGVSFIVLPGDLLSFFVDKFFGGGQGEPGAKPARKNLTPTEKRINDVLVTRFMSTLKETWSEKIKLAPEQISFETNPDFIQASSPDELALQFNFSINVGEWQSAISWIVPYAALEPLRAKLSTSAPDIKSQLGGATWEKHFRKELQAIDLEVSGSFTSKPASIAEVLNLKPGSIVPLKMPTEVAVCIENLLFSYGEHGVLNGHKSIKIKRILKDEKDAS